MSIVIDEAFKFVFQIRLSLIREYALWPDPHLPPGFAILTHTGARLYRGPQFRSASFVVLRRFGGAIFGRAIKVDSQLISRGCIIIVPWQ
jgi:hypothetical protein